jgi:two-component system chemotaxis sensor kinase CheA
MQEATALMSRLVDEIRDGALRLRMVPIGETFSRFQRVVRDVSKELGKDIELIITGAETELDKSVVEKIGDPLTHLVRNSMDHGIESAEARAARGKPVKGRLRLNAYHDSGSIVIEVGDDGGGLNKDRILEKAIERGIVGPNQNLSDREIYNLIFEAGFSTADAVSNLSGRGVGMDVVRRNIEALRGMVELDSTPGEGTTVRIRLPLTLAIIDGFLVGVGDSSYVVPLEMVLECVELSDADRRALAHRAYVNLRGEVLPFVRLRDHFEVTGSGSRRENIVVVHYGGHKAGLVVDQLMGEFQTVIKPLGKMFSRVKGVSGSTILGTGEVALILDVPSLIQQAAVREADSNNQAGLNREAGLSGPADRATASV